MNRRNQNGFTLIELLVVVAVIAVLIGILLPALTKARERAIKTACSANLRQIGAGISMYQQACGEKFPAARYMPRPFVSSDSDPALPEVLRDHIGQENKVFRCPGDRDYVYKRCLDFEQQNRLPYPFGSSYMYNNRLSGRTADDVFRSRRMQAINPSEMPASYDCDGPDSFALEGNLTIEAPSFHNLRNLLFLDGHVGNYE